MEVTFEEFLSGKRKIAVVGLGYVGLPLAILLSTKFKVIGFDISKERIEELKRGKDRTKEVSDEILANAKIEFSYNEEILREADLIIIAVPTPIDKLKDPDLTFIKEASELVGRNLKRGAIVVYESTVWPGLTEEVCVPILERESGLVWKKDFYVGYSPERVNPGDKEHTLENVVKVVAGDTPETAKLLAEIYGSVIKAGVYIAPDIRTAEAAKVIENIQRDINIALINELSIIFHHLGLDTKEVLETASTKWNFLRFEPGLVGGHCIGVDPYYLARKAKEVGYIPQLILAGRGINEETPKFIAREIVKLMIEHDKKVKGGKVLVMGFTFKENVPDVRNTKVYDLIAQLKEYGIEVVVYDPIADKDAAKKDYNICLVDDYESFRPYEVVVVAVKHKEFFGINLTKFIEISTNPPILIDVKGIYPKREALKLGIIYWRL